MALIRADLMEEDLEDKPVKDGQYELRVAKAEYDTIKFEDKKTGEEKEAGIIKLMLVVEGSEAEGASPINHTLFIPSDSDEPAQQRSALRDLKRFFVTFGIPLKDFDPEEDASTLVGATGKCNVKNKEAKNGEMYPRLTLPRV